MQTFEFSPDDWVNDQLLAKCSAVTRGVWIDLICRMRMDGVGHIEGTQEQLARLGRCTLGEISTAIHELNDTNAANVYADGDVVKIVSRRITREHQFANGDKQNMQNFEAFWQSYPDCSRKQGDNDVKQWFKRTRPPQDKFVKIMNMLDVWKEHWQRERTDDQYLPNPYNFLTKDKYKNDPVPYKKKQVAQYKEWSEEDALREQEELDKRFGYEEET